jgi:hypothetical protein
MSSKIAIILASAGVGYAAFYSATGNHAGAAVCSFFVAMYVLGMFVTAG